VVKALLADGGWRVRALTRDPSSEKSRQLAAKGVELATGDVTNKQQVLAALKGAHGFFAVTPAETFDKEFEVGKGLVDAAKEAGVQHFVWSSLPNADKITGGKIHVPHFTNKALVEDYARESGLRCTIVLPPFYYQNFKSFFPPKEENGVFVFSLPMPETSYLTAFDVDDLGPGVAAAFKSPNEWVGKRIIFVGDHKHPQEYVKEWSEILGKPARYQTMTVEQFIKLGIPHGEDYAHMFQYYSEYGMFPRDWDTTTGKKANPQLKTFSQWLQAGGWSA